MAKHFSADQWRVWFLEFERSDLTVAKFCESAGVSGQSYYKWRRRLNSLDSDDTKDRVSSVASKFVSVSLPSSKVEIEFPGGAIARISNNADSLRPLVKVLLEQGVIQ